jgi:hypothetical protein
MPANVDGVVTGGISGPDCMTAADVASHLLTPVTHFWGDFVNTIGDGNDVYADAPVDPNPWTAEAGPGVIETFAILRDAVKLVNPRTSVDEIISITEAIVNGGMFLAAVPTRRTTPTTRHRSITSSPWQAKRRHRLPPTRFD